MTEQEADVLSKCAQKYFQDLGWEEKDVNQGLYHLSATLRLLNKFDLPIMDVRYPEVLRAVANLIQASIEIEKK